MAPLQRREDIGLRHREYGVNSSLLTLFVAHNLIDRDELPEMLKPLARQKVKGSIKEQDKDTEKPK